MSPYRCAFGTIGKRLMRKVHFGFTMFQITMQKLLDIEQFCQKKFNKIKTQNLMKIGEHFNTLETCLDECDFLKAIF
jgi:hypothetical protein